MAVLLAMNDTTSIWHGAEAWTLWQALSDHLTGKGVTPEMILACGLARQSTRGGKPYDVFRNRIMFPIRDARGRCIAFGGRAMDPNDNAKYLNSPETEIFDKSRTLYNHGPAREAAGKGAPLIVAEGYMDVIALSEAGFTATVAPLGTAITAPQLELMWRLSSEPVIALDGDRAGLRAAMRLLDVALPLLQPGRSLRFALLPEGQDPDDLLRAGGAAAMQKAIDAAQPMVQLLWKRETDGARFDSPERRAGLDKRINALTAQIPDPSVRHHYRQALRSLQWESFRPARRGKGANRRDRIDDAPPATETRRSLLAAVDAAEVDTALRERVILAVVLATPAVLDRVSDALADLPLGDRVHDSLRRAVLDWHVTPAGTLAAHVAQTVGTDALAAVTGHAHVTLVPAVRRAGDVALAERTVAEEIDKLATVRGHAAELREALQDVAGDGDTLPDRVLWRVAQATEARNRARRPNLDDRAEFDLGANGAKLNRDERTTFEQLIRGMSFTKPRDRRS